MKLFREVRRPTQCAFARSVEVDGADNVAEEYRLDIPCFREVDSCQYRTIGIMKNLGGNRSNEESPEPPETVSWHDDEVHLFGIGEADDGASNIAFQQQPASRHVPEFLGMELLEHAPHLLATLLSPIRIGSGSRHDPNRVA